MEKKNKKKKNLILFSIFMVILFFVITELIIYGSVGSFIVYSVLNFPMGSLVIAEAILAALVLVVMLLFKNSYVFTQKKEKFKIGLFYGLFFIISSCFFMLMYNEGFKTGPAVINIALGYFLVGICEEFLCRGWLLNEFLERFGETKKGIWISIFISSVIFGIMHISNIFTMGQAVSSTMLQIVNAFTCGVLFGVIYYKTKNIWSVVFLHGLWDFSLGLSAIAPVDSLIAFSRNYSALAIVFSLLSFAVQLICIIPYIKDIDYKPKKGTVIGLSILAFILSNIFTITGSLVSSRVIDTYEYDNLSLKHYAITTDNYDKYMIDYSVGYSVSPELDAVVVDDYSFKLELVDNKLTFTNNVTGSYINFDTYMLYDYIIVEEDERFLLAYIENDKDGNVFLNYLYLPKNELSNTDEYLENVKLKMKKYLLKESSSLVIINDDINEKKYLAAYSKDSGYYVLTDNDKMAILNRDNS